MDNDRFSVDEGMPAFFDGWPTDQTFIIRVEAYRALFYYTPTGPVFIGGQNDAQDPDQRFFNTLAELDPETRSTIEQASEYEWQMHVADPGPKQPRRARRRLPAVVDGWRLAQEIFDGDDLCRDVRIRRPRKKK